MEPAPPNTTPAFRMASFLGDTSSSSSGSGSEKDSTAEVIKPDRVPSAPVRLAEQNYSFRHLTLCHCVRGVPDLDRLREALQRAVTKNPVVAGRLRPFWLKSTAYRPDGLEIAFDSSLGCHFQVRAMPPDIEDEVEMLDAERYARQFLRIHSELAEELGIDNVGFGLNLVGKDLPMCIATFCPGTRVSVIALSISRMLGEAATLNGFLRCWDEEYASPGSSIPLPGGGGQGAASTREVLLKTLLKPLVALHEALDNARQWVYQTTVLSFGGCCATRGEAGPLSLLGTANPRGGPPQERSHDDDDDAPEDREFYAIAARIREETMASIRLASMASAPVGAVGSNGNAVLASDAVCAWLGNVLRAEQLLVANHDAVAELPGCFFGPSSATCVAYSPPGGPGRCHASGIRTAINSSLMSRQFAGAGAPALMADSPSSSSMTSGDPANHQDLSCSAGRNSALMDIAVDVQVFPTFGTDAHYLAFELHDLWQRMPRHCVARCTPQDYIVFHCVCRRDQVSALQQSWRRVGETALSVTSEAQLVEYLDRG